MSTPANKNDATNANRDTVLQFMHLIDSQEFDSLDDVLAPDLQVVTSSLKRTIR